LDDGPGVSNGQFNAYSGIDLTEPADDHWEYIFARRGAGAEDKTARLDVFHLLDGFHQLTGQREYL